MKKHTTDEKTEPPTRALIEALEVFGYKPDHVKHWTRTRAEATLDAVKKTSDIAQRRAAEKAVAEGRQYEGTPPVRGFPLPMMRLLASFHLESDQNADDLCGAIATAVYQLDDSELRRVAPGIVKLLKANDGRCPLYLRHLAEEIGGSGSNVETEPCDPEAGTDPGEGPGPASGSPETRPALHKTGRGDRGACSPSLPGL